MISEVNYKEILDIRKKSMYPNKDIEFVKLTDDDKAIHIGYIIQEKVVSVVSLFLEGRKLQFRKFATLPQYQNNGYGSKIMDWILDYAKEMKLDSVWCNARKDKTDFYKKFGFIETDITFERNGIEYIIVEKINKEHLNEI